jgi:hypothetical protein
MKSCKPNQPVECEERDRLDAAYEAALLKKHELESELASQLTSPNANVAKQAQKRLDRESRHAGHLLEQWLIHWKKHGCR